MKIFSERLKALRLEKGLTQRDMEKILGIDNTTYMHYEKHDGEPRYEMLVKIALFFGVSSDYLLGLKDY